MGKPAGLIQALREQRALSTPSFARPFGNPHRLVTCLFEQIREQDRLVALRTMSTQSDGPAEQPTGLTAALTDEALLAVRTLIDRMSCESALALQLTTEIRLSRCWRLASADAIGELFVGRRAEFGSGVCEWTAAHPAS